MFHEWLWEDEISAKYASTRTESLMPYLQTAAFAAKNKTEVRRLMMRPKCYICHCSPVNSSFKLPRGNRAQILIKTPQRTDFSLDQLDNGVGVVLPERCQLEHAFANFWRSGCVSSHKAKRFFRAAHRPSRIRRIKTDAGRAILVLNRDGRQAGRGVILLLKCQGLSTHKGEFTEQRRVFAQVSCCKSASASHSRISDFAAWRVVHVQQRVSKTRGAHRSYDKNIAGSRGGNFFIDETPTCKGLSCATPTFFERGSIISTKSSAAVFVCLRFGKDAFVCGEHSCRSVDVEATEVETLAVLSRTVWIFLVGAWALLRPLAPTRVSFFCASKKQPGRVPHLSGRCVCAFCCCVHDNPGPLSSQGTLCLRFVRNNKAVYRRRRRRRELSCVCVPGDRGVVWFA